VVVVVVVVVVVIVVVAAATAVAANAAGVVGESLGESRMFYHRTSRATRQSLSIPRAILILLASFLLFLHLTFASRKSIERARVRARYRVPVRNLRVDQCRVREMPRSRGIIFSFFRSRAFRARLSGRA